MIGKVGRHRLDGRVNFIGLAEYLAGVDKRTQKLIAEGLCTEKCTFISSRNLEFAPEKFNLNDSEELRQQVALLGKEMHGVAARNVRAKKPCIHSILSWPEGEKPTTGQIEEVMDLLNKNMGLESAQCIYALHENTAHVHLHVQWNKVDPDTYKSINPNNGWTKKALEKTAREVELSQGWSRQEGTLFTIENDAVIDVRDHRKQQEKLVKNNIKDVKVTKITDKARQIEAHTGVVSPQRYTDEVTRIFAESTSWIDFQKGLKAIGGEAKRKGSGVVFWFDGTEYKASLISKKLTKSRLEERFGSIEDYERSIEINQSDAIAAQINTQKTPVKSKGQQYKEAKSEHYKAQKRQKLLLQNELKQERKDLWKSHRSEQKELFSTSWKGRGQELNFTRSVLAWRQAQERLALQERQKKKRKKMYEGFLPFPSLPSWAQGHGVTSGNFSAVAPVEAMAESVTNPVGIFGFTPIKVAGGAGYVSISNTAKVALVDTGRHIRTTSEDEETILAVLQLAQAKWGACDIHGSPKYVSTCLELAVKHGIKITNPELQKRLETVQNQHEGQVKNDNEQRGVDEVLRWSSVDRGRGDALRDAGGVRDCDTTDGRRTRTNQVEEVLEMLSESAKRSREELAKVAGELMGKGDAPWQKPMEQPPINAVTGRPYRGMNFVVLATAAAANEWGNQWATFDQAKSKQGVVMKGEVSHKIENWDKKSIDGKEVAVVNTFSVFNTAQMNNAPKIIATELSEKERIDKATRIIADSGVRVKVEEKMEKAEYDRFTDTLHLPPKQDSLEYFSNALGELAKATAHESRQNRPIEEFGSRPYANDKLITAMTQMFVAAETGIPQTQKMLDEQKAHYKNWQRMYSEDPVRFARTIGTAAEAATMLMTAERKRTLEANEQKLAQVDTPLKASLTDEELYQKVRGMNLVNDGTVHTRVAPGCTYVGEIIHVDEDKEFCVQANGTTLYAHRLEKLEREPEQGEKIKVMYSENLDQKATVKADVKEKVRKTSR